MAKIVVIEREILYLNNWS